MQLICILSLLGTAVYGLFSVKHPAQLWLLPVSFVVFIPLFSLVYLLVMGLISLTVRQKEPYDRPSPFYYRLLNHGFSFLGAWGRVRMHVTGLEKLPSDGCFLFVSNHLSRFDPMMESAVMTEAQLAFISKPSNFKIPIGRRLMWRSCYMPIDRESPRKAAKTIERAAELIRTGAASVGVYPEGHRGSSYTLQEFRRGCFKIALKAGCPIVVSTIRGTEKIHVNFPFHHTDVYFDILDVIEPNGRKTAEISEQVRSEMQRHLDEAAALE